MIKIKFLDKLLSLIYIRPCFYCRSAKEDTLLCSSCRKKIRYRDAAVYKKIEDCRVYACCIYEGVVKELVQSFKYKGKKHLAPVFAEIMHNYYAKLNLTGNFLILSVPIHKKRLKERRYNHIDIAARYFSKLSMLKYNTKLLTRIKDTEKQYKLTHAERTANIKGAFAVNEAETIDKNTPLLLIDDITSTGATFSEIIKQLKQHGFKNITAIALSAPELHSAEKKRVNEAE